MVPGKGNWKYILFKVCTFIVAWIWVMVCLPKFRISNLIFLVFFSPISEVLFLYHCFCQILDIGIRDLNTVSIRNISYVMLLDMHKHGYVNLFSLTIELDSRYSLNLQRQLFYVSRKPGLGPSVCSRSHDIESPYYQPLQACIAGTQSRRWIPIEERKTWPSRSSLSEGELKIYGNCCFLLCG